MTQESLLLEAIKKEVEQGFVRKSCHSEFPLAIYCYGAKAQYESYWSNVTKLCRGLILNTETNEVVARPFGKFFNYEQKEANVESNEVWPARVYEKLDGSLGILYWYEGKPYIATKGSFDSEQAVRATQMLHDYNLKGLDKSLTYLFEIIYAENRVVVNYGQTHNIYLLGAIETSSGKEVDVDGSKLPFPRPLLYGIAHNKEELFEIVGEVTKRYEKVGETIEGFVVKYASNYRVKIKTEQYLRLRKLRSEFSELTVWENLKSGEQISTDLLELIPDEFYSQIKELEVKYSEKYSAFYEMHYEIYQYILADIAKTPAAGNLKKTFAMKVKELQDSSINAGVLFGLFDHKDVSPMIWKQLKPNQ